MAWPGPPAPAPPESNRRPRARGPSPRARRRTVRLLTCLLRNSAWRRVKCARDARSVACDVLRRSSVEALPDRTGPLRERLAAVIGCGMAEPTFRDFAGAIM